MEERGSVCRPPTVLSGLSLPLTHSPSTSLALRGFKIEARKAKAQRQREERRERENEQRGRAGALPLCVCKIKAFLCDGKLADPLNTLADRELRTADQLAHAVTPCD